MRGSCTARELPGAIRKIQRSACIWQSDSLWIRDDDAVNTEERIWDMTQAINVKGVWFGCKHAVIAMRKVSRSVSRQ